MITQHTEMKPRVVKEIDRYRRSKPNTIFKIGTKAFFVTKPDHIIEISNIGRSTLYEWLKVL